MNDELQSLQDFDRKVMEAVVSRARAVLHDGKQQLQHIEHAKTLITPCDVVEAKAQVARSRDNALRSWMLLKRSGAERH